MSDPLLSEMGETGKHELLTYRHGRRCRICGAIEHEGLPTECPRRAMTLTEREDVARGALDYIYGRWSIGGTRR